MSKIYSKWTFHDIVCFDEYYMDRQFQGYMQEDLFVKLFHLMNITLTPVDISSTDSGCQQLFKRLEFFHVNRSCTIEHCEYKTRQIIQNMILSRGLEL